MQDRDKKSEETPFSAPAHVTYPHCPLLAEQLAQGTFTAWFTPSFLETFKRALPGQGFIAETHLITGESIAYPAQNKEDGIPKVKLTTSLPIQKQKDQKRTSYHPMDNEGKPISPFVESTQQLGMNTGDLHTYALSIRQWGMYGGANGQVAGWSFYKAGPGVRLLKESLKKEALIPYEYHLILTTPVHLEFVDGKREVISIPLDDIENFKEWMAESKLSLDILSELKINEMDSDTYLKLIDVFKKDYLKRVGPIDENPIKFFKNRSASQNAYAARYSDLYRAIIKFYTKTHGSHSLQLLREAPLLLCVVFYNGLMKILNEDKISPVSPSEFVSLPIFPKDIDRLHLDSELLWLQEPLDTLARCYFNLINIIKKGNLKNFKTEAEATTYYTALELKKELDYHTDQTPELKFYIEYIIPMRQAPHFNEERLNNILASLDSKGEHTLFVLSELFKEIHVRYLKNQLFPTDFTKKLAHYLSEHLRGKNTADFVKLFQRECFKSWESFDSEEKPLAESLIDLHPQVFLEYIKESKEDIYTSPHWAQVWHNFPIYTQTCKETLYKALPSSDKKSMSAFLEKQISLGNSDLISYLFQDPAFLELFSPHELLTQCFSSPGFSLDLFKVIFSFIRSTLSSATLDKALEGLPGTLTPEQTKAKEWLKKFLVICKLKEAKTTPSKETILKYHGTLLDIKYLTVRLDKELDNPEDLEEDLDKLDRTRRCQAQFFFIIKAQKPDHQLFLLKCFSEIFLNIYSKNMSPKESQNIVATFIEDEVIKKKTFLGRRVFPLELGTQLKQAFKENSLQEKFTP